MRVGDLFLASKHFGSDKHLHGYDVYYEELFENFTPQSILEVGIKYGGSLLMWKDTFPQCNVEGIDIEVPKHKHHLDKRGIKWYIKDSTKISHVPLMEQKYDVVIDDGSHFYIDIMRTFFNLKDNFNKFYVIEDLMYGLEEVVEFIKLCGFNNIKIQESVQHRKDNTKVLYNALKYNSYKKLSDPVFIDTQLYFITVFR